VGLLEILYGRFRLTSAWSNPEYVNLGKIRLVDFQPVALIEERMPVTRDQLLKAMKRGILKKGWHYVEGKHSGSNKYLYHPERLLTLLSDIKMSQRKIRKAEGVEEFLKEAKKGRRKISSERKKRLAEALSTIYFREAALMKQLLELAGTRKIREGQYWETLWERKDCPYCEGSGILKNLSQMETPCGMCAGEAPTTLLLQR